MVKQFKLGEPARPKLKRETVPAAMNPVARVVLDTPVAHLAREFDYLVPEHLANTAKPGVRVKVKFGSQDLDGFITDRVAELTADNDVDAARQFHSLTDLSSLKKVVSPEPVLRPEILNLARAVADYYGGTVPDVLRFAVPPRHARAETAPPGFPPPSSNQSEMVPLETPFLASWLNTWQQYQNGPELLAALAKKQSARFVWTPLPGLAAPKPPLTVPDVPLWAAQIAALVASGQTEAATPSGNAEPEKKPGVLIVAPDLHDVNRILEALALAGVPKVVRLVAEDGAEARYRAFLAVERGHANVVVGTRSAVFAPVTNLSLMVLWGDGDDTLIEPHTPHFNAREVLAIRSAQAQVPLLVGSIGRTVAAQQWVDQGVAQGGALSIVGYREVLRSRAPRIRIIDSPEAAAESYLTRIPTMASQAVREALASGPVLVQVPLTGYLPRFECQNCRAPARCRTCGGALTMSDAVSPPSCRTCGQLAPGWRCSNCGPTRIRAARIGADRTAEELGRAYPGTRIIVSTGTAPGGVKASMSRPRPHQAAIVIATPGAEPVVPGGYASALILDAGATTSQASLDMAGDAVRRWLAVAHLVVPASLGGQVLLVGNADPNATAALVRSDPVLLASRELAERAEAGLPPSVRMAEISGDSAAVESVISRIALASPETMLGPVPLELQPSNEQDLLITEPQIRALLRVPAVDGLELARQLRASLAVRSAKREPGILKAQLDPPEFT